VKICINPQHTFRAASYIRKCERLLFWESGSHV